MSAKYPPLPKFEVIADGNPYPRPPMIKSKAMTHAAWLLKGNKERPGFDEVIIRRVKKEVAP